MNRKDSPEEIKNVALSADERAVIILDQTLLPNDVCFVKLQDVGEMHRALCRLQVRGAPAIGIFAAACMVVLARRMPDDGRNRFIAGLRVAADCLGNSRPTAVNLKWALARMMQAAITCPELPVQKIADRLALEYRTIRDEDEKTCLAIARFGLSLLPKKGGILTHCNAEALAASQYGTALGPVFLGHEQGRHFHVFADETRPLLQGARLTTWELNRAGIKVTLICDSMAAAVMKNGWISTCLVGFDRVAKNGDVANKIGTTGLAILAKHFNIPFYALGPTSSVDLSCASGEEIEIELRDPEEIKTMHYTQPMAPVKVSCYNPAFDITDNSLVTAIITEKGICRAPFEQSLAGIAI